MSKNKGIEILKGIQENIEIHSVEEKFADKFYDIGEEILRKDFMQGKSYTLLYRFPHIIKILDDERNRNLFEEFCKINSKLAMTFAKEDLQNKIFNFLANKNKSWSDSTSYSNLLKLLNEIKVLNVTLVSLFRGVRIEKEEIFGNFKLRKINVKDLEKVYGKYTTFNLIIKKNNDVKALKETEFTFIEYHNTKIRITSDGKIMSSSHHTQKLAKIFKEKFKILSLFFHFFYWHPTDDRREISYFNMSINNIFSISQNAIYIFDDLKKPDYHKGGQEISSGTCPVPLRKDDFGYGILNSKTDEKLLLLIDKDKTGLEKNIYQAIIWAGKSKRTSDLDEAFVQLFIALEALCCEKDISEFVAFYLGENKEERLKYYNLVSEAHRKRSLIVHQNSFANTIEINDYYILFEIIRKIIYKMFTGLSTIKTKDDLTQYIKERKYS